MERNNDSNNQLKSISLEDEKDKKEFTENLIKDKTEANYCLSKLFSCFFCFS